MEHRLSTAPRSRASTASRRLRCVIAASGLLWGVAACSSTSITGGGGGTTTDAYSTAVALWNAKKPAGDRYVMVQRIVCFCVTSNTAYRVTVAGTTITSVVNDRTDAPLPATEWGNFRTVAQLFEAVRTATLRPGTLKLVEYDPTLGFPRTVSLDPILTAADDEVSYVTSGISAAP
jgi:Family of unknown function (DUF6174)